MDACVSREAFNAFCAQQYPPTMASKTMRREKCEKIIRYLKGLEQPPIGSWRYRVQEKGYSLQSFPALGLKDVLCLKGPLIDGSTDKGVYGEWRKVVPVEEFYDVLLEAHVKIQNHGGYKNLLKTVEVNYAGVPREAAMKFVSLCSVCRNNPRQRLRAAKATEANRGRVTKTPCITHEFNMRCQIDLIDMSQNQDGSYVHIGLYTDHWTKFMTLFPMMGSSAEHVAYGLVSSVFPYFGPPQFLHSSEGKEFAAEVIRLSLEKWKGGEKSVVPQAKPGLLLLGEVVEATRDTLIQMINERAMEERVRGPVPWARWLGKIMFDLNNKPSAETGKSPYSRVFERTIGVPESAEPDEPLKDFAVNGPKIQGERTEAGVEGLPLQQQRVDILSVDGSGAVQIDGYPTPEITEYVIKQETAPPHIILQDEADAVLPVAASEILVDNPVLDQRQTFTTLYVDPSGIVQSFIINVDPAGK